MANPAGIHFISSQQHALLVNRTTIDCAAQTTETS